MNKVILIGNLTRDPELSTTNSGTTVCKFGIAVNRTFVGKSGERETDFFNITVWGVMGENCHKYLRKGRKVGIVGRIELRNYETDGVKKLACDIIASDVEFLSSPNEGGGQDYVSDAPAVPKKKVSELTPLEDEELPF